MILCSVLVAGLSVLSARLIQIQLVDRQQYAERARSAYHQVEVLPAMRGMIVDRHEQSLAKSIPVTTVYVDKNHLTDPKLASFGLAYQQARQDPNWEDLEPPARRRRIHSLRGEILALESGDVIVEKHLAYAVGILARPLGLRREELHDRIANHRGKWFPIVRDLPEDVAEKLREAVDTNLIQGIQFENSMKRWYSAPNHAVHVLGFTGEAEEVDEDGLKRNRVAGRFGVEAALDEFLAGRDGWREHRRDARGLVVPGSSDSLLPPRPGLNVQLTLDMGIQAIVEEEIDAACAEYDVERAAVIVMDPKTGEVLAMATRPHFDLNRKEDLATNGFNYAIQAMYEPGSTIKIVAAAAALNEGLVNPLTQIFCHNGRYRQGAVRIPEDYPASYLSVQGVLQKSNNTGSYMLAQQVGMRRFYDYVERWGFGKRSGILLSGESAGLVRNSGNVVDFSRASFGYAMSVTPLQMASAYSVIGGDGKLMQPRIVKALVANDGTEIESYPPKVVAEVLKPRTAAQMREALQQVTETGGTATRAAVPGFNVAGKTGTARKANSNGRGYGNERIVSFAGMLPAEDPAFVCVVVLDNPRNREIRPSGGLMAAPTFQKIAARTAVRMNLQPTEPVPTPLVSTSSQ